MAVKTKSEYQRAARLRWPTARIFGDGPFALYCEVLNHVDLYPHFMLAATDIARDHSNWRCKDSHSLVELKPVAQRRVAINRSLIARMERD
jgi:hypothetical protein